MIFEHKLLYGSKGARRAARSMRPAQSPIDVPVPFTPVLENAYRPDVPRILEAARDVMQF